MALYISAVPTYDHTRAPISLPAEMSGKLGVYHAHIYQNVSFWPTGHSAPVTVAIFAPVPGITVDEGLREVGQIIVAADYQGSIKVYVTGEVL